MGDKTGISWCDATWEVRLVPEMLAWPLRKRKPIRIFVNSMSDLFHEKLTNEQIAAVFGVMAACPQHTFQVLTKRAKRMREWFEWAAQHGDGYETLRFGPSALLTCAWEITSGDSTGDDDIHEKLSGLPDSATFGTRWPLPNVWLGVSVENQEAADERIPELLRTPAAVRFLSCEPLLGPVSLGLPKTWLVGATARKILRDNHARGPVPAHLAPPPSLDWIIAGCESGPGARPCEVEWLRSLRDQCAAAGVPFFLKQARQMPYVEGVGVDPRDPVTCGPGSSRKPGGVIELPYLDGVQHAAFPEVSR